MATAVEAEPIMAKRSDTPVRIDNAVLANIRIAAAYLGKSIGEYISDHMAPIAERDIEENHSKKFPAPKPPKSSPKR